METTRLSSKGQVLLPKSLREAHHFLPGLEFAVEERPDGILLRPLNKPFAPTRLAEVLGCADYRGPARSLAEMDAAIARGVIAAQKNDSEDA